MSLLEALKAALRSPPKWVRTYLSLVIILYGCLMMYFAVKLFPGDFWHLYSVLLFGALLVAVGLGKMLDERLQQ